MTDNKWLQTLKDYDKDKHDLYEQDGWDYIKLKPTGNIREVIGGPQPGIYVEVERSCFGIKYSEWLPDCSVKVFAKEVVKQLSL